MVMPGEDASMVLKLGKQMVLEPNQQFTIRAGTSTIGTGKVSPINFYVVIKVWVDLLYRKDHMIGDNNYHDNNYLKLL
jgi:hypothetical protein